MRRLDRTAPHRIEALGRYPTLPVEVADAAQRLGSERELHRAEDTLSRLGGSPRSLLVLWGWAAEQRTLLDGRRQILRIKLPGDICVLREQDGDTLELHALTGLEVVDVTRLRVLVETERAHANLAAAWRRMQIAEAAGDLRQMVRLGRLSALERTGHMLLELYERLTAAGMTTGMIMPLPLTQIQMADYLALSVVHANRVLQQLRRDHFIEMRPRQVVFRDMAGLARLSQYRMELPAAGARA